MAKKPMKAPPKGGKVIRKAEGGLANLLTPKRLRGRDGPSDTLAATPKMDTEGLRGMPSIGASKMDTSPKASSPKSSSGSAGSFSEAFRAARKRGDKTFMWNGELKTTKLKEEVAAPKTASKPAAKPATPAATKAAAPPAPKAATPAPKATSTPAKAAAKAPEKKATPLPIPRVSSQDMRTRFAPSNQTSFAATAARKKRNEAVAANARAAAKAAAEAKRNPPKSWREDDPYKMAKGGKVTKKKYV